MSQKIELAKFIEKYKKFRLISAPETISEATIRSWSHDFLKIFGWDVTDTTQIIQEKNYQP